MQCSPCDPRENGSGPSAQLLAYLDEFSAGDALEIISSLASGEELPASRASPSCSPTTRRARSSWPRQPSCPRCRDHFRAAAHRAHCRFVHTLSGPVSGEQPLCSGLLASDLGWAEPGRAVLSGPAGNAQRALRKIDPLS